MKILELKWKNVTSYGAQVQEILFDEHLCKTILLVGQNGTGKSSISSVIKYVLYGKLDNMNISDFPNRFNKSAWTYIKVKSKNKIIEIERGIQPSIFNIIENGVPYDEAGKTNKQDYLEREYLEIPFNVFTNTLILSINDFKSFLSMAPNDKRKIIDKLFGFSIINEIKDYVKSDRKNLKEKIDSLIKELNLINNSILSITNKIKILEEESKKNNQIEINQIKDEILKLIEDKNSQIENLKLVKEKFITFNNSLKKESEEYNLIKNTIDKCLKDLELYKNDTCPTCGSDLDTNEHNLHERELIKLKELNEINFEKIKTNLISLKQNLEKIRVLEINLEKQISKIESILDSKKNELKKLSLKNGNSEYEQLISLIKENEIKKIEKQNLHSESLNKDSFYEILDNNILSDNGIKNQAIKSILPSLNQSIKLLSSEIHLPFQFKFNESFECEVKQAGHEVNIKTLSTGEKKKADFITIIAIIQLLKIKYPSINILFLDEIFSSVDQEGVYNILNILNRIVKNLNLNTIVMNHYELPVEIFDTKITTIKNNGWSKLQIENLK